MSLYYASDESFGETEELIKKCYPPAQEPEEPSNPFYCAYCGNDVCLFYQLHGFIEFTVDWEEIEFERLIKESNTKTEFKHQCSTARKLLYGKITRELYGYLGRGNRVVLPDCILQGVRGMYPDPDDKYMGHKDE